MSEHDPMVEFRKALARYDTAQSDLRGATEEAQKAWQRLYDMYAAALAEKEKKDE